MILRFLPPIRKEMTGGKEGIRISSDNNKLRFHVWNENRRKLGTNSKLINLKHTLLMLQLFSSAERLISIAPSEAAPPWPSLQQEYIPIIYIYKYTYNSES